MTAKCHCNPCSDPQECQRSRLRKQLDFLSDDFQFARSFGKSVILHCRDNGFGEAAAQTLSTIHHIFYLPCFNGEAQELLQWEKGLHHAKFGVTMKSFQDQRIVALIPLEQLLLETDTLYLPPAPGCRLNHPWNVLFLAKQVYFIRNTLDRSSVCPLEGG